MVLKAERSFKPYQFLVWLDEFVQLRKGKTNLTGRTNIEDLDVIDDIVEELQVEGINPGDSEEDDEDEGVVADKEEAPREAIVNDQEPREAVVGKQQQKAKIIQKRENGGRSTDK